MTTETALLVLLFCGGCYIALGVKDRHPVRQYFAIVVGVVLAFGGLFGLLVVLMYRLRWGA